MAISLLCWVTDLLLLLTVVGSLVRDPDRDLAGDKPEYFDENIKPLVDGIGKATKLVLYEGLPREKVPRARELTAKKTVTRRGFPFYEAAVVIKEEDWKRLSTFCSSQQSFT